MQSVRIDIDPDGTVRTMDTGAIDSEAMGEARRYRASHVVPDRPLVRLVFQALRRAGGDTGQLAWLSRWLPGPWVVRIEPTGHMLAGLYPHRADAIRAELDHFRRVGLPEGVDPACR